MFILLYVQLLLQVHLQVIIAEHSEAESIKNFEFIKFVKLKDESNNNDGIYNQMFDQMFSQKDDHYLKKSKQTNQHKYSDDFFLKTVHNSLPTYHLNSTIKNTAYIYTQSDQQLHIDLFSLDRFFSMILLPSVQLPVFTKRLNRSVHFNTTCYTGYLKNSATDSKVFAYFHQNLLNAIIYAFNDVYHLDELRNHTVIMYKESDHLEINDLRSDHRNAPIDDSNGKSNSKNKFNLNEFSKRRLMFEQTKTLYPERPSICFIELVADHTFAEFFNHDPVRISSELFLMLMNANYLFNQNDFNEDGKADGISLQAARIIIFHTPNEKGYYWADTKLDGHNILNFFGLRIQEHCLAFLFVHREFHRGLLGLAWKGDVNQSKGICAKPVINTRLSTKQFWSANTGIVTNLHYGSSNYKSYLLDC